MKKIKIAICDIDADFVNAFVEYLMQEAAQKAEFLVYTSTQSYEESSKTQDIALLGEPFWELRGKETLPIYFSAGGVSKQVEDAVIIEKYQQAGEILRQIFFAWQTHQKEAQMWRSFGRSKQLIGVYAPGGHEMQIPFTLLLAKELTRKQNVLYLNLMECSGLSCFLQEEWNKDLSDLIAMLQHERAGFGEQVESVVYTYEGISYIPPMKNPANLYEISGEWYEKLLTRILEETEYEVILLDFGSMLPGFYSLAEKVDALYCLTKKGRLYQVQTEEFFECLKAYDSQIVERIEQVEPDMQQRLQGTGGNLLGQLEYSPLGDLTRELIQKGGSYGTCDDTGTDTDDTRAGHWSDGHALRDCG